MKNIKNLLGVLLIMATSASAQNGDNTLAPFSKVSIRNSSKVNIHIGPQAIKIIEGNPDEVKLSSENGTLIIKGMKSVLDVTIPELNAAEISGNGTITADSTIRSSNLRLDISGIGTMTMNVIAGRIQCGISGSGKLNLSGTADEMQLNISGTGKLYARELTLGKCEANISGVGKCYADVTNDLQLNISGTGAFYYKTEPPKIGTHISGIGKYGPYPVETADTKGNDDNAADHNNNTTVIVGGSANYGGDYSVADSLLHKPAKARSHWGGIDLGFNQLLVGNKFSTDLPNGYDFLELNSGKSLNVNLNFFYHDFKIYRRNILFTTGLGLTLQNYRFTSSKTLISDTNKVVAGFDYDKQGNKVSYEKNKLAVNYVTVPLLIQFNTDQRLKKSFHIATGILFSYKYNSHLKLVSNDDGKKKSKRQDEFSTEPLRTDLTLRFGYRLYTVYASYALTSLFKNSKGPELHPFNIGINILGW
ncbi:hypothetical protein BH11BAC2_BH11BAC2_04110 [soil metagenome]